MQHHSEWLIIQLKYYEKFQTFLVLLHNNVVNAKILRQGIKLKAKDWSFEDKTIGSEANGKSFKHTARAALRYVVHPTT